MRSAHLTQTFVRKTPGALLSWAATLTSGVLALLVGGCPAHGPRREPMVFERQNLAHFEPGAVITANTKFASGVFMLPGNEERPALRIEGNDLTVDFAGATLRGASADTRPDRYVGVGIEIIGRNIRIENLTVSGYKVGIHAHDCDALHVQNVQLRDLFRQRLGSTPDGEDPADWLFPHDNDNHEWMEQYGAGIYVEKASGVGLIGIVARDVQNGIILDRVAKSEVRANDCSFLSGWGLAMWRSNENFIAGNAFDFCIRGYSHGIYNRGQDSAGILMFEQCNDNVILGNSATHCGDGLFGFAGKEALGERLPASLQLPSQDPFQAKEASEEQVADWVRRRGNNRNAILGNDFSYAAAHGIEMTFSFDNVMIANRLSHNAICGIWGGYSQDTTILGNEVEGNGDMGYGAERGGVNIEHGYNNLIARNRFSENACGVRLWSDEDQGIRATPWGRVNERGSDGNRILTNFFENERMPIELRQCGTTFVDHNGFNNSLLSVNADAVSVIEGFEKDLEMTIKCGDQEFPVFPQTENEEAAVFTQLFRGSLLQSLPEGPPRFARGHLAGRQNIIMTQWGPYDHESTLVTPEVIHGGAEARARVLGQGTFSALEVAGPVEITPAAGLLPADLTLIAKEPGLSIFTASLEVLREGKIERHALKGTMFNTTWNIRFYAWTVDRDPRTSEDEWQWITAQPPIRELTDSRIEFHWNSDGPFDGGPRDHFATAAVTRFPVSREAAGRWRIVTDSDDGVRVFLDGREVLSNWTWHGPTEDAAEVELTPGEHELKVEHFEIDGWAVLTLSLEPAINRKDMEE